MSTYGTDTAVVVVDMQHDFGDPEIGSLYVTEGEILVDPINALTAAVLSAGGQSYFTQDWHPTETPHFITSGGLWPAHGVAGTPGAELLPDLVVNGPVIRKGIDGRDGYSGFSVRDPNTGQTEATVLGEKMKAAGIKHVIVVGLAGDYCVGETAIDAATLGFHVEMPLHLTRFVNLNAGDDTAMIARVTSAGVTVN